MAPFPLCGSPASHSRRPVPDSLLPAASQSRAPPLPAASRPSDMNRLDRYIMGHILGLTAIVALALLAFWLVAKRVGWRARVAS